MGRPSLLPHLTFSSMLFLYVCYIFSAVCSIRRIFQRSPSAGSLFLIGVPTKLPKGEFRFNGGNAVN